MPPKNNNRQTDLNQKIRNQIELTQKHIEAFNSLPDDLKIQSLIMRESSGSIKSIRQGLLQLIVFIAHRKECPDFDVWKTLFEEIIILGNDFTSKIKENAPFPDVSVAVVQLSAWLKVVDELLVLFIRGANKIDCSIYQLMPIYIFDVINNNKKERTPTHVEKSSKTLDKIFLKPLIDFAIVYRDKCSCIPERVFVHDSLIKKNKNILLSIAEYLANLQKNEIISAAEASDVVEWFLLGKNKKPSLMNVPDFNSIYSNEAEQKNQPEQEVKYDNDKLWRDDGNRILATLIKYNHDSLLSFLKETYNFELRNEDLIFICEFIGIKEFSGIDDRVFNLLIQLKNNSEPEREAIEEFKKTFEKIFNHHLDEQREIKRKNEEKAMASFLPEANNGKKSKSGKKIGRNQKKRGNKKKKKNEKAVASVQETPETLSLTKNLQNIEERPDVKTENTDVKPESLDMMMEISESEIETLSRTLEMFCSNNGYGKFGLANKLERLLTGLDVLYSVPEKKDGSERLYPGKNIYKVINNTKEIEKKLDKLLRYNPYSNLSANFANQSVNIPDELLDLAKDCAKVVILCDVVKIWSEAVEKNFDNKRFERLSIEGWRQWKRNVFLKYFVANKIKDFIREKFLIRKKFPKIIYDNEKQCYQIVSNALSDNVLAIFNKMLEDRGMFGRYLSDLRQKGNKVRVNTPRFWHDEKSHEHSSNQTFGKLCAQLCINNKDEKIERSHEILEELIDESCTSGSKVFDVEKMSELDFSDQLIASFILFSPGQVSLPRAFRTLKEHQIYSEPEAIKIGSLPYIPLIKAQRNYPVQSVSSSSLESLTFKKTDGWSYHPVLAKLPQNWFKDNRTFYLGGGFAGLLGLGANLEQIEAYWAARGDIDLLCIGDIKDILPSLRNKIFRSYPDQYTLNLFGCRWVVDNKSMVCVDLVHITPNSEDVSPSELIRIYKENSSISIVESVVYELSANGCYRLVYGDEAVLRKQVTEKSIELVNREQLQQVIDEIKKRREHRDSWKNKNKNDPARDALPDMDDLGLSLLKFFKTVIKLSFLEEWKKIFSIGPYSQKLIVESHKQIIFILKNISPERKKIFLQNMFEMPKDFVYRYLQLLLEQRLFYAFFYINPNMLDKHEKDKINEYNKIAENIEQWFGLYTDKNSERLHNQTTVFLVMENYFKSKPKTKLESKEESSNFEFLKSMAKGCHQHVYKRSFQEVSRNKSSEPTLVDSNLFRRKINEFRRDFDNEQQQFLKILLNPKSNVSSSARAVFSLQEDNLISSARKCYEPSEIEIKDVETVPLLAKQLCKEIMHELYAQVMDKLTNNLSIKNMPVSKFLLKIDHETFSVNLNKDKSDRSHKSEASDDNHTLVVFFVNKSDSWHTFLGVFEKETNEGDVYVKAPREAVSFLEDFDSGKEISYCTVAPYLGAMYEWSACHLVENSTVKIPLLEKLLERKKNQPFSSGKEEYKPDEPIDLPIAQSLTQEQNVFIKQAFQRISGEENMPSILMGPPGTGKTRTLRELVFTIEKHPDISAQSVILAHSKSVVKQVGCGFASSDEPITVVHVTDKSELDEKDPHPYPSLDALLGKSKGNGKSRGWISGQLTVIKESKASDIGEDVQKIHKLQQKVRQLIPVFSHQINAVLNVLIKQLVSDACDRGDHREKIFKESDKEIQSLIWNNSSYKAAILATSQVVVSTLHGAYNSSLRLALTLRQEILPNERRLVFVEEASRAPLSSLFPALVRCMSDVYSQEKGQLIVGGDLLQLGSVTHGQLTRSSVLRWFSECKGSWFQLHSCFRTGPRGVKRFSELGYQASLQSGHHDGFFEQRSRALTLTNKVPYLKSPFMFINTEGNEEQKNNSYLNKGEIDISLGLILSTVDAIVQSQDATLKKIAIIAMYKAQAEYMKQALRKMELSEERMKYIKCGTVDEFQGDEASIVFVSLVRTKDCGHILHIERLIVALSRAIIATVIIGNQALLEKNAQMIMTTVEQNPIEIAFQNKREGLFIKRCAPDDETVLCLVKGHEGRSFWCRLSQKNRQDTTIQVEVLLKEQRSNMSPSELADFFKALKQQEEVMYDFELSSFSLEQIKQEKSDVLEKLTLLLLNRMASRMPTPYITTRANLALVYQYVKQDPESIISAESLYSTMRNS